MMTNIKKHQSLGKQEMIRTMILQEVMILFSIRSTVAVQLEDGGPWIHGTVVGKGDHNHNNKS